MGTVYRMLLVYLLKRFQQKTKLEPDIRAALDVLIVAVSSPE